MFNIDQLANYFYENIRRIQSVLFSYLNINPLRCSIKENFKQKFYSERKSMPQNDKEMAGDEFYCNIDDVENGYSNQFEKDKYLTDNEDSSECTDEEYDEESEDNSDNSEVEYEFENDEFKHQDSTKLKQVETDRIEYNINMLQCFKHEKNKITNY